MNQSQVDLLKKIYNIVITCFTILLGILIIFQALDIYLVGIQTSNPTPYNPESIWEHFKNVAIFLILWIVILIAGYILHIIYPSKEKLNTKIENKDLLEKLQTSLPDELDAYQEQLSIINKEKRTRLIVWIVTISLIVISSVLTIIYMINPEIFKFEDSLKETADKFLNILPYLVLIFGSLIVAKTFENYSYKAELDAVRKILSIAPDKKPAQIIRPTSAPEKVIMTTRIAILVVAIFFIVHGIINGGAYDVFKKATAICMECIGMG